MSRHPIVCAGPCGGHQPLGTVELPDDTTPAQTAAAMQAYLGETCDCGPAYRHAVSNGWLTPGQHPTVEHVTRYRNDRAAAATSQPA